MGSSFLARDFRQAQLGYWQYISVSIRFRVIASDLLVMTRFAMLCDFGEGKVMAKRKRSQTISLRIHPFVRSGLELLAGVEQKSLTGVIEDRLLSSLKEAKIPRPAFLNDNVELGPEISLFRFLQLVWHEDEAIFKTRLHIMLPEALDEVSALATSTVFHNLDLFEGGDDLFDGCAIVLDSPAIPKLNVDKLNDMWVPLLRYAQFLIKNRGIKLDFQQYITAIDDTPVDGYD
ncbi:MULTISPECIES: hypothetical protein [Pseudomonas]|uniref:hypothetical protein n=1 Tax=Pseudomonas TaxID=286 RepID=UPI0012DC983F|nr:MULTISPECIES: hypothetical protein [Pseudomonas]WBG63653.1 hypothetical protein ELR50_12510 [Pseudomonas citronellolis]